MRLLREFRIIPVVLFAAICLLTLKLMGILSGEGYVLGDAPFLGETLATRIAASRSPNKPSPLQTGGAKQSWAQEMFHYPDVTGSVAEKKPAPPPSVGKPPPAEPPILDRLQERRQELEARARELEIRDGLLKAAEMHLEARLTELKALEA